MIKLDVKVVNVSVPQELVSIVGKGVQTKILQSIARGARAKWVQLARTLNSSRKDYIASIQHVEKRGPQKYAIVLDATGKTDEGGSRSYVYMIEHGADPYDMRDTLLAGNSKKIKTNKETGSRYRSIMFRHQTEGTSGVAGQPMGSAHAPSGPMSNAAAKNEMADFKKLGALVHTQALKLNEGQSLKTAGMKFKKDSIPKLRGHHIDNIFEGMKVNLQATNKLGKDGSTEFQRTYSTFRMISDDNLTGDSWMHPGITARNFSGAVADHAAKMVPMAFKTYVEAAMKKRGGSK